MLQLLRSVWMEQMMLSTPVEYVDLPIFFGKFHANNPWRSDLKIQNDGHLYCIEIDRISFATNPQLLILYDDIWHLCNMVKFW